jgi:hypothetical protein
MSIPLCLLELLQNRFGTMLIITENGNSIPAISRRRRKRYCD